MAEEHRSKKQEANYTYKNLWVAVSAFFFLLFCLSVESRNGDFAADLNSLIKNYNAVIMSLGALFLVPAISIISTIVAGGIGDRRDRSNREFQSVIQVSEFRQVWINDLRSDFSEFTTLLYASRPMRDDEGRRLQLLFNRIIMRMNHSDRDFKELLEKMTYSTQCMGGSRSEKELPAYRTRLLELMPSILKREWERLKSDLEAVQGVKSMPGPDLY